jgi:hypothetical protein
MYTQNINQKEESGKRKISFSETHLEVRKYEEKKVFLKNIRNLKPDVFKGKKEIQIFLRNKYPHLF